MSEEQSCRHNFVKVTLSSWRDAPYWRCPKCGAVREISPPLSKAPSHDPPHQFREGSEQVSKSLARRIDAILQPWRDDETDGATSVLIEIDLLILAELAPKRPLSPSLENPQP